MANEIKVEGVFSKTDETELNSNELMDLIHEFCEQHSLSFGGSCIPLDENGEEISNF